jgi:hypothetical protein
MIISIDSENLFIYLFLENIFRKSIYSSEKHSAKLEMERIFLKLMNSTN